MTDCASTHPHAGPGAGHLQRRRTTKYVLMLGALAALPAVTTDIYLPSAPTVAADLDASQAATQLTISGLLLGAAVGQLVIGPLSDRYGRRPPLIAGIGLHVLVSLLCSVTADITWLVALRLLQGFFNAAATVVAIAVIRDRFVGSDAARIMSRLMLVIGVAPLLAPTAGQLIAGLWHWRAVFWALALLGLGLLAVVTRWMPETLPPERRRPRTTRTASGYWELARDPQFLAFAAIPGLSMAVIMSYVVGSPFVFQDEFGLSEGQFAAIFAFNGIAMVAASQLNASLVRRITPARVLRAALVAQAGCALVLLGVLLSGAGGLAGAVAGLWLVLGCQGFILANASMLALGNYGHMAGTAAAVIGSLQAGIAGAVSPVVGLLGGSAAAMATVILGSVVLALAILAAGTPVYRRGGLELLAEEAERG
jgi:DHA1 family bicyclomycin/chloramphenicol resistance-like MFS transporter